LSKFVFLLFDKLDFFGRKNTSGAVLAMTFAGVASSIDHATIYVGALLNDPGWAGKRFENHLKVFGGLLQTDPNREWYENVWMLFSRATWELPQTAAGYGYTSLRNTFGNVDRVEYFGGATFAIDENVTNFHGWSGVSLGNYINAKIKEEFDKDYPGGWIYGENGLYLHEYGHTKDSKLFGLAYLLTIGIPSAADAEWTEIRANNHAWNYMRKHKLLDSWDDYEWKYPLK
jgi:hypothetical protein